MAITENVKKASIKMVEENSPVFILVNPQLAENVGMVARAMMNCGLINLRLVKPREDWLSNKAFSASSGAGVVLEKAGYFETVEDAIKDINHLFATTARRRDMVKPVLTAEKAGLKVNEFSKTGAKCGFLFGPERTGLENDHVALADSVVEIPLNPAHCSLNLAQAVLLVGYEWYKNSIKTENEFVSTRKSDLANKDDLLNFFKHLEDELDNSGYLRVVEKRPRMVRNIRNIFNRAGLTQQEVRTLHGIVSDLVKYRIKKGEKAS